MLGGKKKERKTITAAAILANGRPNASDSKLKHVQNHGQTYVLYLSNTLGTLIVYLVFSLHIKELLLPLNRLSLKSQMANI